jgi:hypothetical protein
MDRGGITDSAVRLAEAAALSDDPWYGERLRELARELAVATCQVLESARPTRRTACRHWVSRVSRPARSRLASWGAFAWLALMMGRLRRSGAALSAR